MYFWMIHPEVAGKEQLTFICGYKIHLSREENISRPFSISLHAKKQEECGGSPFIPVALVEG